MLNKTTYICEGCGASFSEPLECADHERNCEFVNCDLNSLVGKFYAPILDTRYPYKLIRVFLDKRSVFLEDCDDYVKCVPLADFSRNYTEVEVVPYTAETLPIDLKVVPVDEPLYEVTRVEGDKVTISTGIYETTLSLEDLFHYFRGKDGEPIAEIKVKENKK